VSVLDDVHLVLLLLAVDRPVVVRAAVVVDRSVIAVVRAVVVVVNRPVVVVVRDVVRYVLTIVEVTPKYIVKSSGQ
jgi:hypothetical protein